MISQNKKAFTFIEMIISVAIVILLAVIGNSYLGKRAENSNNSKVISDLEILDNSLSTYSEETGTLPLAGGNNNFFKEDTSYSHSWEDSETYGTHGFITQDTIPKKYLNYLPVDPITNQYYGYGRTKKSLQLEIAGVIIKEGEPIAVVNGNYTAETGPYNLIREYNGPDFVYDNSKDNFPYNPNEKLLTAKIENYSGSGIVTINDTITDVGEVLSYTLIPGDKIKVDAGTYADIYFSDGTVSTLGDETNSSELILSEMVFSGNNNLITKIKLVLGAGTIWNKATNLADSSEFEVYTTDSSAAVRGTIFGVNKLAQTNITVKKGKVKVDRISGITTTDILNEQIKDNTLVKSAMIISISEDSLNPNSEIEVLDGIEKGIDITVSTYLNNTGALLTVKPEVLEDVGNITNTISPEIKLFSNDGTGNIELQIKLNEVFRKKAQYFKIKTGSNKVYILENNWALNDVLSFSGTTVVKNIPGFIDYQIKDVIIGEDNMILSFCKERVDGTEICSKGRNIPLKEIAYNDTELSAVSLVDNTSSVVKALVCKESEIEIRGLCIENSLYGSGELIAYAPYNKAGNLNMYTLDGTKLPLFTNNISAGYELEPGVPSLQNIDTLPPECEQSTSFCKINGETGIFIDKDNTPIDDADFLKYDLSKLNLGNKFAIEINVLGENTKGFLEKYLYDFNDTNGMNNILYASAINKIYQEYNGSISHQINTSTIEDTSFYDITAIYNITNWDLKLNSLPNNYVAQGSDVEIEKFIFIGSKNNSDLQWNGIINYVKIYKLY